MGDQEFLEDFKARAERHWSCVSQEEIIRVVELAQGKLQFDAGCIESSVRGMIWTDFIVKYHNRVFIYYSEVKDLVLKKEGVKSMP